VTWEVAQRYGTSMQGGIVAAEVSVADGEKVDRVMTW